MTSVMRAAAGRGPKILRIAFVQNHRVVEERLVRSHAPVTIGRSEHATLTMSAPGAPALHALFERRGEDTYLVFTDDMTGRLALASGFVDLRELAGQLPSERGARRLKLTADSRGKIDVAGSTILFQFVDAPPEAPKPRLPISVTASGAGIDWRLAVIVAFSFLSHFGFVGALYSDWMDPVMSEDYEIGALVDLAKSIPLPPETPAEAKPTDAPPNATTASTPKDRATTPRPPTNDTRVAQNREPSRISDARANSLADRAEAMRIGLLATTHEGPAVQGALDRSDIPPVDVSEAARTSAGATTNPNDLRFGSTGPVRTGSSDLTRVGPAATSVATSTANERGVEGPKFDTRVEAVSSSAQVKNADAVVARLRGAFRKCYTDGLARDGAMSGRVVVAAKIGPNGEVASSDVASNQGLSAGVGACMARVVRNAQFEAPATGGVAVLQIPISFVQQK